MPDVIFRDFRDGTLKIEWFIKKDNRYRDTIDKHELSYYSIYKVDWNYWRKNDCVVTIEIPLCHRRDAFAITSLYKDSCYEIRFRAHTSQGYGEYYYQKVCPES
ncbi:uncharacterized protein LOC129226493 [Uloborus diversus]|uniref:uncharacterized protein LOC129226493 n=1 Tax=Uloborus diversus TaxID=327109 RepID=UPI00240A9AA8|nr:uncharacterized protein LOC129226493 [Uloborus diversus]